MLLYTINKLSEREIKKTIPFTIETERIKYLVINSTKEVKDLYAVNYKTLLKETERQKEMERYSVFMDWKN